MTANIIQLESTPLISQGSAKRKVMGCSHRRLTFDFDQDVVTCRECGLEWHDFLSECKVTK